MFDQLKYFYTNYGEVYAGVEWQEIGFKDYTIVIPFSKILEYRKVTFNEKTIEKIKEFGWVLRTDQISKIINGSDFIPPKQAYVPSTWDMGFNRDIVFIIGAGASAHCVFGSNKERFYEDNLRPPVGLELFANRFKYYYKKFNGLDQALPELQNDKFLDLETLFENEWLSIQNENSLIIQNKHISIQYYLQQIFLNVGKNIIENHSTNNCYEKLACKLHSLWLDMPKRKFAFISFNQDTVLENFLSKSFNKNLGDLEEYIEINESPFCIFKPHGSCNWGWKFPNIERNGHSTANWLFENCKDFYNIYFQLLGDHINMIDWGTWGHQTQISERGLGKYTIDKSIIQIIPEGNENYYYPCLLLPYRDKDEFTMPFRHFIEMETYLTFVKILVIIGWKGNERVFNRLLNLRAKDLNKIIVVDPNPKMIRKHLNCFFKQPNITIKYYNTFEEFVLSDFEMELIF
jgi:hypothetical protein